jgi:Gas vesicle protein
MTNSEPTWATPGPAGFGRPGASAPASESANLADILERILNTGIVIVGDIKVNLLDIELLTIRVRLVVASVDKAREMGIDWWEHDPALSSRHNRLSVENEQLKLRIHELEVARGQNLVEAETTRAGHHG